MKKGVRRGSGAAFRNKIKIGGLGSKGDQARVLRTRGKTKWIDIGTNGLLDIKRLGAISDWGGF